MSELKAYVLKPFDEKWDCVCVTEYMSDGFWICGMNLITSLADAIKTAEEKGVCVMFESMLKKEESHG